MFERRRGLSYWVPLALPVLIGLLLPALEFQSGIKETETLGKAAEVQAGQLKSLLDAMLSSLESDKAASRDTTSFRKNVTEINDLLGTRLERPGTYVEVGPDGNARVNRDLIDTALEEWTRKTIASGYSKAMALDLRNLLNSSNRSLCLSIISVDVWALTTLLTVSVAATVGALYAAPLLSLFVHIILLIMCNSVSDANSPTRLVLGAVMMIVSLLLGWAVREGMWRNHEGQSPAPRSDRQESGSPPLPPAV